MSSSTICTSSLTLHLETPRHVDSLPGTRILHPFCASLKMTHTSFHCALPFCHLRTHPDVPCKCSSNDPPSLPDSIKESASTSAPVSCFAEKSLDVVLRENGDRTSHPAQGAYLCLAEGNGEQNGNSHPAEGVLSPRLDHRPSGRSGETQRFPVDRNALWRASAIESRVLTSPQQDKLKHIMNMRITREMAQGCLVIRALRPEQLNDLETLLADSYSELMWGPLTYRPALVWILATYLRERQENVPDAVTLVALYSPSESITNDGTQQQGWLLAGAVEVSFNAAGKPKNMQTPVPPNDAPFLSNMAVIKKLRRRGIGKELLKAAEDLAVQMGCTEMYLHCRMVDEAPLTMYKKSGYKIVDTDSILSLITFQRRRHLMQKTLSTDKGLEVFVSKS